MLLSFRYSSVEGNSLFSLVSEFLDVCAFQLFISELRCRIRKEWIEFKVGCFIDRKTPSFPGMAVFKRLTQGFGSLFIVVCLEYQKSSS